MRNGGREKDRRRVGLVVEVEGVRVISREMGL